MEETLEPHPLIQDGEGGAILYKLSRVEGGSHAGWVQKKGADFVLFDKDASMLKSIKGRLVERKESIVSELMAEPELTLLCKVCESNVPLDDVEKHAKTCAISFPVQIIRFEHSLDAEDIEKKKKAALNSRGETEVATLEDFPHTVITALEKSGVPLEMYAKHLDVLVNVLNFFSKMKFRLAESRPTMLADAANFALKNHLQPDLLAEVCKIAHGCTGKKELALAKEAVRRYKEGLLLLEDRDFLLSPRPVESRQTEGQRILAAQKEVQKQATLLYEVCSDKQMKRLYELSKKVGEGGYGKVYNARCKDKKMQPQEVAIKIMQHVESDAKAVRTNLRELLYLTKLRHPNIVALYRAHLVNDKELWLVLEFMEGGTLREASKVATFEEGEVAFCAFEILKAVAFMHENGCVHRDIKSHNVMMTVEGQVKLIDLGLVADVKKGISTMRGILGTTFWIPPEMIRGEPHSYPADIWSLGICLLELCHGYPPNRDSKLRALFLAGAGVAPGLEDPARWSEECHSFFVNALVPEQSERATAASLLAHPWIGMRCSLEKIRKRLRHIFMNHALESAGFF